jgi:hypothetical protein
MKIMIGLHHPKHYWMFRNFIIEGKKKGWIFKILVSKKDVLENLLKHDEIEYTVIGCNKENFCRKIIEQIRWIIKTVRISRKFKPDFLMGRALISFSFVKILRGGIFIIFEDSEPAKHVHKFTVPFADAVITPKNFKRDFKEKHVRADGYDELYYLHPNWFTPDRKVLYKYGIDEKQKYVILRFVSWNAYHDVGRHGINDESKLQLIGMFEKHGYRVYITSEKPQEKPFDKYTICIKPYEIHHLLAYASLYVGDSQTMATEAALLGTPSVRINSFVGENDMSNFIELEKTYGLLFSFRESSKAIVKLEELMAKENIKEEWAKKRQKMLDDKIDMTEFLCALIEKHNVGGATKI